MKKQFDRFLLTDQIGQAGGGTVYQGQEQLPGGVTRAVTVKVLPAIGKADAGGEKRFVDEVRTLAALASQPHVVTFYGMGISDGVPWIATEQTTTTLAGVIGPTPADPAAVARMIEHVARGLAALHALEPPRLHNRLQPANILVCPGPHYKVAEFGLSAAASAEPTLDIDAVRYAAPELLNKEFGKPGPAADLYALGHIAYEMATGSKIHAQQFPAVMDASGRNATPAKWQAWHHSLPTIASPTFEILKAFPEALSEVIAKLMSKPLASRYATAGEVVADLQAANASTPLISASAPPAAPSAAAGAPAPPTRFGVRPPPVAAAEHVTPAAVPFATRATAPARPVAASPAPAVASPANDQRYYVRLRNRTSGPFDLGSLQRLVKQGQLSRLHQVSVDQRTWKGAGTVEGLF